MVRNIAIETGRSRRKGDGEKHGDTGIGTMLQRPESKGLLERKQEAGGVAQYKELA